MRWVYGGGGGGLLIGLCSWVVFVVCVCGGDGLSQAITFGCGSGVGFFGWLSLGFFFYWICGFVEFWLFLCVILVGFWDDFVAKLMDLGCVNGGLWTVEVVMVVGRSGGGWGFGFAYCSSESSDDWCFFFFFWQWGVLFYCGKYIILF